MSFFDLIKGKLKKTTIIGGIIASTATGQAQSNENQSEINNEVKIEQISSLTPKMEYNFHSGKKGNISWFSNVGNSKNPNEYNITVPPVTDEPTATIEEVVEILSNPEYMAKHSSTPSFLNEDNSIELENGQTVIQNEKNPNLLHFLDKEGNEDSTLSVQKDAEGNLFFTKFYNDSKEPDWSLNSRRHKSIIKKIQPDGAVAEIQENVGIVYGTYQKPDGSTRRFTEVDGRLTFEEAKNADGTWNATKYMPDGSREYFEKDSEGNSIKKIYDTEGKITKEYLNGELINNNKEKESSLSQEDQKFLKQSENFQEEKISDEKEKTLDPIPISKNFFTAGEGSSIKNKVDQVRQSIPEIESPSDNLKSPLARKTNRELLAAASNPVNFQKVEEISPATIGKSRTQRISASRLKQLFRKADSNQ